MALVFGSLLGLRALYSNIHYQSENQSYANSQQAKRSVPLNHVANMTEMECERKQEMLPQIKELVLVIHRMFTKFSLFFSEPCQIMLVTIVPSSGQTTKNWHREKCRIQTSIHTEETRANSRKPARIAEG